MNCKTGLAGVLLYVIFATSASAHRATFGIISDDIWNMIDDNLTLVDSPHRSIDFDDVTGSMRVMEDPDDGSMIMVTSITVRDEDADDYMAVIEGFFSPIFSGLFSVFFPFFSG